MTDKTAVDWKHWGKLKSVKVFEALALLSNSEPSEEPQELEDASPEYRKLHRLLLDSLADRAQFTAGTLNMGNASLNGVSLIEVARWALANGITLPDNFPRLVRVNQAPPPISPIRCSSRYIPPDLPPVPHPRWSNWGLMRDVELWEAVALSLNFEPNELPVYLGAYEKLGDDPFRTCPPSFLDRLLVVNSNCGISFGFKPVHKLKARCLVDLPEFAAWAVKRNIPDLPPELVAMTPAPAPSPAMLEAVPVMPAMLEKPWLVVCDGDPVPSQSWYTPARYFARQLVIADSTLLTKRGLLAEKVSLSLANIGIKKRGGKLALSPDTVLKAFANANFG